MFIISPLCISLVAGIHRCLHNANNACHSSNLEVIAISSPHNFDLLKSRGADHVFDSNSPSLVSDIRNASNSNLRHAFDCVSSETTSKVCAESLEPNGKYSSLIYIEKLPREDVEKKLTVAYTALGEDFSFGPTAFPRSEEDFNFAAKFQTLVGELLEQGKIKPHPHQLKEGGLGGILEGLQELREKKVSGKKLVYSL